MRRLHLLPLFAVVVATGCAEEPFVNQPFSWTVDVDKQDQLIKYGTVDVCYAEGASREQITQLAAEQCSRIGLQAWFYKATRNTCAMTASHTATFYCIDPNIRDAYGVPVPQAKRTIKPEAQLELERRREGTASSPVTPPVATPLPAAASPSVTPPGGNAAATPAAAEPRGNATPVTVEPLDFTLPVGSWGDAFRD